MKQLFEPEELIGKTIEKTIIDLDECEDWWIKFTDGSFVILGVRNLARASYEHHEAIFISNDKAENTDEQLVDLGIITQAQYEEAWIKRHEANDLKHKEEERIRLERIDAVEREQYERLKKKFERQ
jgi:hypothetical protein